MALVCSIHCFLNDIKSFLSFSLHKICFIGFYLWCVLAFILLHKSSSHKKNHVGFFTCLFFAYTVVAHRASVSHGYVVNVAARAAQVVVVIVIVIVIVIIVIFLILRCQSAANPNAVRARASVNANANANAVHASDVQDLSAAVVVVAAAAAARVRI